MQQRTALVILFAATLLIRTGYGGIGPVLPIYVAEHGLSPWMIALMTNAYLASHALLQEPAGHLSDRLGRRPVLAAGAAIYALVAWLFLLRDDPWFFTLLRVLEGLAASAVVPVVRAAVVDLVPPEGRGKAFGALTAVENAGYVVGPLVGGLAQAAGGISAPFVVGAALSLLATLSLLLLPQRTERKARPETPRMPEVPGSRPTLSGASPSRAAAELWRILKSGAFWAAALPGMSMAVLSGFYSVVWSLYMQACGASAWEINLSWGAYSLPLVLLLVPFGALADRGSRPLMVLVGGLMATVITLGYGLFPSPLALLILSVLDGLAGAIYTPASQAFVADVTPGRTRGRFLGLVGSASTLATMAAVTLTGALYTRVPDWWLFAGGALVLGICTLLSVWLMVRRPASDLRRELEEDAVTA